MMTLSFSLPINATSADIWELYSNIDQWRLWEENLESIELDGEFITGTKGKMKLEGKPDIAFSLTSVIPNSQFENKTILPFGELYFSHLINRREDDCLVTHAVMLKSDNASEYLPLLTQIFNDIPAAVIALKRVAEAK